MREWDVVMVIIALVGLFTSVYRPMTSNTKAMTELNITMQSLSEKMSKFETDMDKMDTRNHESHKRIWDHNDKQDEELESHEKRITLLEEKER